MYKVYKGGLDMSFKRLRLINILILPIAVLLATGCGSDAYVKEIGDGICELDANGCPIDPNDPDCTGDYSHCNLKPDPKPDPVSPIPSNMIIDTRNPVEYITSICDKSFNPPISVIGVIDNGANKITVPLHYTVAGDSATLGAYTKTVKIDPSLSEEGEANVFLSFVWGKQQVSSEGYIMAEVVVDDSAGNNDGRFVTKCRTADRNYYGVPLAIFDYPVTTLDYSQFTIKVTAYVIDDDGGHIWLPIVSPNTGAVWLNNNLDADYITVGNPHFDPHQQAVTSQDPFAYGGLYQWGRKADGHQLVKYPNKASGVAVNGETDKKADEPTGSLFIKSNDDWRVNPDKTLWLGIDAKNRVCPKKFRLASGDEWKAEYDGRGALGWTWLPPSFLKLTATGRRNSADGLVYGSGVDGHYWTSTVFNTNLSFTMFFNYYEDDSYMYQFVKAEGNPVRCRMDDKFL